MLGIFLALKTTFIINSVLVVTVTLGMGLSWEFRLFDTVQSLEG